MVAHENIGLAFFEILRSIKLITDKRENTECPRPQPQKEIADVSEALAQQKRNHNTWQVENHKHTEHQEYPHFIQGEEDSLNNFQVIPVKTSSKVLKV